MGNNNNDFSNENFDELSNEELQEINKIKNIANDCKIPTELEPENIVNMLNMEFTNANINANDNQNGNANCNAKDNANGNVNNNQNYNADKNANINASNQINQGYKAYKQSNTNNSNKNNKKRKNKFYALTAVIAAVAAAVVCIFAVPAVIKNGFNVTGVASIAHADSYNEIYNTINEGISKYENSGFGRKNSRFTDDTFLESSAESGAINSNNDAVTYDSSAATKGINSKSNDYSKTNEQVENVHEADIVITDGRYIYSCDYAKNGIKVFDTTTNTVVVTILPTEWKNDSSLKFHEMYINKNKLVVILSNGNRLYEPDIEYIIDYDEPIVYEESAGQTEPVPNVNTYGQTDSVTNENAINQTEPSIIENIDNSAGIVENEDTPYYPTIRENETYAYVIDVANPTNYRIDKQYTQAGLYADSRMTNNVLYLFTDYYKNEFDVDSCVPMIDGKMVKANDVYYLKHIDGCSYVTASSLDVNNPKELVSKVAFLGDYSNLYVTQENIYIATSGPSLLTDDSYIIKVKMNDGNMIPHAQNKVPGVIKDQFSFDEKDGMLRVVTQSETPGLIFDSVESSNVFIFDENMRLIGKVRGLAPDEDIKSVRFVGDMCYLVTFRETDPLFSIDLSNSRHPKVVDRLAITGFSDYLHPWDTSLLLGLGYEVEPDFGNKEGIKVQMFDTLNPLNVKVKDVTILDDYRTGAFSNSHKAVLVDKDKNLIGFAAENLRNGKIDYIVLSYDVNHGFDYKILELANTADNDINYSYTYQGDFRGLYINDKLYVVNAGKNITVFNLYGYSKISEVML